MSVDYLLRCLLLTGSCYVYQRIFSSGLRHRFCPLTATLALNFLPMSQIMKTQARKDLTLAAASGHTLEVGRAIELGAEVDSVVNTYTPLMRAANWGHVDTVAELIAEGADMFATDRRGCTALDWARIARRDNVARVLERAMENEIRYRRWFACLRSSCQHPIVNA